MEPDLEDEGPPEPVDSDAEEERGPATPPIRRWHRVERTKSRRSRKHRKPEVEVTLGSTSIEGIRRELEERPIPSEGPSEGTQATTTGALTVITATSINGLKEVADEWEEIEFMVDQWRWCNGGWARECGGSRGIGT